MAGVGGGGEGVRQGWEGRGQGVRHLFCRCFRAFLLGPKKVLSPLYLPQGRGFTPLCKVLGSFHISLGCLVGTWEETGSKTFPQHRRGLSGTMLPHSFQPKQDLLVQLGRGGPCLHRGCSSKSGARAAYSLRICWAFSGCSGD